MNKRRSRTLLLHKDRRFAGARNYLLWSFDQRRTEVNRSVSVKINSRDLRAARFEEIVNEEGFEEKLRLAVENKNSAEAAGSFYLVYEVRNGTLLRRQFFGARRQYFGARIKCKWW